MVAFALAVTVGACSSDAGEPAPPVTSDGGMTGQDDDACVRGSSCAVDAADDATADAGDSGAADGTDASTDGSHAPESSTDAPLEAPDAPECEYPDVTNEAGCPASGYGEIGFADACPHVGLECQYPGAGDGVGSGCFATKVCTCVGPGSQLPPGADASAWLCSQ